MSLAQELLNKMEPEIESITLIPSIGGRYEVTVNDALLYSKLKTGRHANPGEVFALIKDHYKH